MCRKEGGGVEDFRDDHKVLRGKIGESVVAKRI